MTQAELSSPVTVPRRYQHLDWVIPAFIRPRRTFEQILKDPKANWGTPILLLTVVAILQVITSANLVKEISGSGQVYLPPQFQYFTPGQQAQLEQAIAVSSGPVFTHVFPISLAILKILLGWLMVGAGLHLLLTMMGGRGTSHSVMNFVAWGGLPFALRDLVHIGYMFISKGLIRYPGLSGFASLETGSLNLFIAELLKQVDVYWLWHAALLFLAIRLNRDLKPWKAFTSVAIIQIMAFLLHAVPGVIAAQFGNLTLIRPFF